jgi:hypothetical protein
VQRPAPTQDRAENFWSQLDGRLRQPEQDSPRDKVHAASEARQRQADLSEPEWLIPPHISHDRRDSLGRGLDPASVAAAIAADADVQKSEGRASAVAGGRLPRSGQGIHQAGGVDQS